MTFILCLAAIIGKMANEGTKQQLTTINNKQQQQQQTTTTNI